MQDQQSLDEHLVHTAKTKPGKAVLGQIFVIQSTVHALLDYQGQRRSHPDSLFVSSAKQLLHQCTFTTQV